jgi:hypothetical protein
VYGRLEGILDSRLEPLWVRPAKYLVSGIDPIDEAVQRTLGRQLDTLLREAGLNRIEEEVRRRIDLLPENAPFPRFLNGDFTLARLCYALGRALKPKRVVETGVCYGVTSAFLLQSLEENGGGVLHSVDMPPLGKHAEHFVGKLVPEALRSRWELHRGTSKSQLPQLLQQLGEIDFFIHDSLHTYRNMRRELSMVTPYLARPALVVSDDVDGNPAFGEWVDRARPPYWTVLKQGTKSALCGMAIFCDAPKPSEVT